MIYLDNAATTRVKPPQVAQAVVAALDSFGGVGRGVHEASLDAGMAVYKVREQIAQLFGAAAPTRVAFTCNVTEALNIALAGLLHAGDHAITTAASHNSVLRPLYKKQSEEGVELSILPVAANGSLNYDAFDALFQKNTRLAVVTHASNLTGDVYDIARMARIAHDHGALMVVDAAQTAGVFPIDMAESGIDVLCFTGHKSLYGPQGTGGLCVAQGIEIPPFKVGGTGIHSYDRAHPTMMPESLEAGTINAHGIAGLGAGVAYIQQRGVLHIQHELEALTSSFEQQVRAIEGIQVYGGHGGVARCGIVALNVRDYDSAAVADVLSTRYDICTRAGAHCAPLMHQALGTSERGAVRFSFSTFTTQEDIGQAVRALREIAQE